MNNTTLIRPGIARGFYPEKENKNSAWLDQFLSHGMRLTQQHIKSRDSHLEKFVAEVNKYKRPIKRFNDQKLFHIIRKLKSELIQDFSNEKIIAKSFAIIKEVADRKLNMPHYDVQLIGGWIMLNGMLAEMQTGEGKTLTATLPACTAAMAGIPVHIISVNDYLVTRDAKLMKPIFETFGLTVGIITEGLDAEARRAAYACDITYCTSKQLIFDYLKDHLILKNNHTDFQKIQLESLYSKKSSSEELLMRGLCFAIVDEVDSILIDEARTPLILSKQKKIEDQKSLFKQALDLANKLVDQKDYQLDQKFRTIELTNQGDQKLSEITKEYSSFWQGKRRRSELIIQALSAKLLFLRDQHYLVSHGEVHIIDEHTGRPAPDRKWDHGLHQMIEIKERCTPTAPTETLARISNQQFFKRYLKLSGMTGTASEVSNELWNNYRLGVVSVLLHKPSRRNVQPVQLFDDSIKKWTAVLANITKIHKQGRPILLATSSVKTSELLSLMLKKVNLPHQILNAKQDQNEAEIISRAGNLKQITIATNMAGRGTDIKLAAGVADIGGLHVVICEPNVSRRIDRQIVGRCARQGDPGSVAFFYALDDEIIQIYRSKKLLKILPDFGNSIIPKAQKSIENHHRTMRQALVKSEENIGTLLAFSGSIQ